MSNRKSYALYRMVMLTMTLGDPNHPNYTILYIWRCFSCCRNGWR